MRPWLALIVLATTAAYLPAIGAKLIMDDNVYLTPPLLRPLAGLAKIWFDPAATKQYYPLLHSAFWFEHRLWGDSPLGYHLVNVALHATAACLFVLILRALRVPGAVLAGFVFALHPVCVETAAWISEQKNTLSTVFYLLAAIGYLRFDASRESPGRGRRVYAAATACFACAILSKSVAATLPAALLVLLWWRRGRLEWRRDVIPLLPWFVLALADGLFTSWIERRLIGAEGPGFAMGPAARVLVAGRAIWFYLGKLAWPADLQFIYPRWTVDPGAAWQYLPPLAVLAALGGLWLLRRKSRAPLAVALLFAGALFSALGFLNVYFFIYSFVADHLQYLAALSVITAAAAVWARWAKGGSIAPKAVAVATVALLATLTWRQCRIYRDSETLYRDLIARNPACWVAHYNLGALWADEPGRSGEAIAQFEEALRLRPDYAQAEDNLGAQLARVPGRLPEALAHFARAVEIEPRDAMAHNNLAQALLKSPGRLPEAVDHLERALQLNPHYVEAHVALANALVQIPGRIDEAVTHYQRALQLDPNLADVHNNLANVLMDLPGRLPEAIVHFNEALRLDPRLAAAHHNLAIAYANSGSLQQAADHFRTALQLDPSDSAAREDLRQVEAGLAAH